MTSYLPSQTFILVWLKDESLLAEIYDFTKLKQSKERGISGEIYGCLRLIVKKGFFFLVFAELLYNIELKRYNLLRCTKVEKKSRFAIPNRNFLLLSLCKCYCNVGWFFTASPTNCKTKNLLKNNIVFRILFVTKKAFSRCLFFKCQFCGSNTNTFYTLLFRGLGVGVNLSFFLSCGCENAESSRRCAKILLHLCKKTGRKGLPFLKKKRD